MSFPFLMQFIQIEMTAFHEFSLILALALVINTFLLTYTYSKQPENDGQKKKLALYKILGKMINVAVTALSFMQLFISDYSFDIGEDVVETEVYQKAMESMAK